MKTRLQQTLEQQFLDLASVHPGLMFDYFGDLEKGMKLVADQVKYIKSKKGDEYESR